MKLAAPLSYRLRDFRFGVTIYYAVVLAINILIGGLLLIFLPSEVQEVSFGVTMMSTPIFLFVFGLNSFREDWNFMTQMGRSRKTFFVSFLLLVLCVAPIVSAIDLLINGIMHVATGFITLTLFSLPTFSFGMLLTQYIFLTGWYIFLLTIGLAITVLMYHLKPIFKALFWIVVGVGGFIALPIIDVLCFDGVVGSVIMKLLMYVNGSVIPGIWTAVPILLGLGALFAGTAWLGVRTCDIKA